MKKLFAIFLVLSFHFVSFGAYLENVPTQLVQPNGELLNLFITGDEFFRRVHDSDGYSIVPGSDGWYYYALYDAEIDELVPSEYVVTATRNFELPMAKGLGISYEKYIRIRQEYYEPTDCDASGASKNSILNDLAAHNVKATQQMNNIIICIGFSDTQGMTNNFNFVNGLFNTNANNNLRDYFSTMSYDKIDVVSHFYPPANGTILRFYQSPHPRSYYESVGPSSSDPNRPSIEHTLLRDAILWVNENWPVPADLNLDINNDGRCDYITFVVFGPVGGWSWMLWPHKWSLYTYNVQINGKRVYDYNFELDGTSTYFNVGTFCHEGYHQLGAPDLYHYNNYTNISAVGSYDIMESTNNSKPQSMSAYMKCKYGKWVSPYPLPAATINMTYEVFPFYTNDGTDPEKPVIHRIPMTGSSSQYSVVEYRKKTGTNYDANLLNEGLLIYRINSSFNGNAQFNATSVFDEVYLYRTGSSQTSGVYTQGTLAQAPYNATNGKTSFNSTTNPKPCQSNGTVENTQNINNILYDNVTDSYTFFYGNPANRSITANKTELTLDQPSGTTGTVTITANVLWRIAIPSSDTSWLSVSKTKGLNTETVTFTTLSDNTGEADRTTNVTITGNNQTLNVNVTQLAQPMIYVTINVSANPPSGGVVTGNGIYGMGEEVTVTAIPNDCYFFANWTEGSTVVSTNPSYTFSATENSDLVAHFVQKTYNITLSATPQEGGTASGGGTNILCGTSATVTATPEGCYNFVHWTKDGEAVSTSPSYTFVVTGNHVMVAHFVQKTYHIALSATPQEGGTASGGGTNILCGTSVTVTATPNMGYNFINWTEGSTVITTTSSYMFIATENRNLTAHFVQKIYNISLSANPTEGGTVSGGGAYNHGDNVSIFAVANTGYLFTSWTKEGVTISTEPAYSFTAIENENLEAAFDEESSIKDIGSAYFKIFPNPAGDLLYIHRLTTGNARIEIYNSTGMLADFFEINDIETIINVSKLPSGVYLIKLTDNQNISTQRFIKE